MTNEEAIKILKGIEMVGGSLPEDGDLVEEALLMAIKAFEQTRWIPCSERLPEKDVNVLTYHRNESFDYQYVSWIDDYSGKWAGFIGNLSDDVLAWMPLPEPYKAESEVNND